jgi:hypothetical protein
MRERYPTVIENPALLEKLIKESVNVLAFIYGQVYFPYGQKTRRARCPTHETPSSTGS